MFFSCFLASIRKEIKCLLLLLVTNVFACRTFHLHRTKMAWHWKVNIFISTTQSNVIAAKMPVNVSLRFWTTGDIAPHSAVLQANKTPWAHSELVAQAGPPCLPAYYPPRFEPCSGFFFQLSCPSKPLHEMALCLKPYWRVHFKRYQQYHLTAVRQQLQKSRDAQQSDGKLLLRRRGGKDLRSVLPLLHRYEPLEMPIEAG